MSSKKSTKSEKGKKGKGGKSSRSPRATTWSLEKYEKYKKIPGNFINVESNSKIKLTNAERRWATAGGEDLIFEPHSLLAGPKADVLKALKKILPELRENDLTKAKTAQALVDKAFSADNYEDNAAYDAIIEKAVAKNRNDKEAKATGQPTGEFKLKQLSDILESLRSKKEKTSPKKAKKTKKTKAKTKGGLIEVYKGALATKGKKAVDVSNFNDDKTGTGARSTNWPKAGGTLKSIKNSEDFPIYSKYGESWDMAMEFFSKHGYPKFKNLIGKWNKTYKGDIDELTRRSNEEEEEEEEAPKKTKRTKREESEEEEEEEPEESEEEEKPVKKPTRKTPRVEEEEEKPVRKPSRRSSEEEEKPVRKPETTAALTELPAITPGQARLSAEKTAERRSGSPAKLGSGTASEGSASRFLGKAKSRSTIGKSPTKADGDDDD